MVVTVEKGWESVTENIVPCWACKGSGIFEKEQVISYHNNDYEYYNEVCGNCDGEGRLLESKYNVRISVTVPNKSSENIDFAKSYYEKLNGRTVEDIYKINLK